MATVTRFEDLEIWKNARGFSLKIYELTCQGTFAKDFALKNQINDSSGSIMDNVAEGFERDGRKEFITFLSYAKASAGEARSQLYRALDRKHINEETFNGLQNEALRLSKMIASFIHYLKRSDLKGIKFSEPLEEYTKLDLETSNLEPET
jgi:four helix bundle protein